jgi:hypothetical protein
MDTDSGRTRELEEDLLEQLLEAQERILTSGPENAAAAQMHFMNVLQRFKDVRLNLVADPSRASAGEV